MEWEGYRNYVIGWVESKKDFDVFLINDPSGTNSDFIDWNHRHIFINSNLSFEIQTYRLLHECGHILIEDNGTKFNIEKKAKRYNNPCLKERTYTVLEEIEAWKRAYSLAQRLSLPIDDVKWEEEYVSAISKYILWASNVPHWDHELLSS